MGEAEAASTRGRAERPGEPVVPGERPAERVARPVGLPVSVEQPDAKAAEDEAVATCAKSGTGCTVAATFCTTR